MKKQFSPALETAAAASTTATPVTIKAYKSLIPTKIADLHASAERVSAHWATVPSLVCFWKTQPAFAANVTDLGAVANKKAKDSSKTSTHSATLKKLDASVNKGVAKLKGYLEDKYDTKKAAIPHYSRFGMVHYSKSKSHILPRDREERLKSFAVLLNGLKDDGFETKEYGKAWWTALAADYKVALDASKDTREVVSGSVGQKKVLEAEVRKVMQALLKLLEGNYPDTYYNVALEWGIVKSSAKTIVDSCWLIVDCEAFWLRIFYVL